MPKENLHPAILITKSSERNTPVYYRDYLEQYAPDLSIHLRDDNDDKIKEVLRKLSFILPTDLRFKEIASLIALRNNGDLHVTTAEGTVDQTPVDEILNDLLTTLPTDSHSILFLHTHPNNQAFNPLSVNTPRFSATDKTLMDVLGTMLRIYDLTSTYSSLIVPNNPHVLLYKGTINGNNARAFGWQYPYEDKT